MPIILDIMYWIQKDVKRLKSHTIQENDISGTLMLTDIYSFNIHIEISSESITAIRI